MKVWDVDPAVFDRRPEVVSRCFRGILAYAGFGRGNSGVLSDHKSPWMSDEPHKECVQTPVQSPRSILMCKCNARRDELEGHIIESFHCRSDGL
jgi:hypothetical protein